MTTRDEFGKFLIIGVMVFLIVLLYVVTDTAFRLQRQLDELALVEPPPVTIGAAYDPTTGDVWFRINEEVGNERVAPKLCPKSMSF
jgi:hypothetical protein